MGVRARPPAEDTRDGRPWPAPEPARTPAGVLRQPHPHRIPGRGDQPRARPVIAAEPVGRDHLVSSLGPSWHAAVRGGEELGPRTTRLASLLGRPWARRMTSSSRRQQGQRWYWPLSLSTEGRCLLSESDSYYRFVLQTLRGPATAEPSKSARRPRGASYKVYVNNSPSYPPSSTEGKASLAASCGLGRSTVLGLIGGGLW
jgi:hypothetical protein